MKSLTAVVLVLSLSAICADPVQQKGGTGVPMARANTIGAAAKVWVDSLTPEMKSQGVKAFDDENRFDWDFFPRERLGLSLADQGPEQRLLLDALLREVLSEKGYMKVHAVFLLEEVLGRDPLNFHATVFGDPDGTEPWGFRLEGHHLSLNITVKGGRFVTGTPLFLGASPAEVPEGTYAGFKPFYPEEKLARQLTASLDAIRRDPVPEEQAPKDIFLMPGVQKNFDTAEGIHRKLSFAQRFILMQLVNQHASVLHQEIAQPVMNRYRDHDIDDIRFLWRGSRKPGEPFYYRISCVTPLKDFAIEVSNTDGNHVHAVWRDFGQEFGAQKIAEEQAATEEDG